MTLHPFLPVGIQDLDNNFAHFLDELLLVFLLHVAAGVGRRLRGLTRGGAGGGGDARGRPRHRPDRPAGRADAGVAGRRGPERLPHRAGAVAGGDGNDLYMALKRGRDKMKRKHQTTCLSKLFENLVSL